MVESYIYYKKWKYTPAVRSKISSKLIFASCVGYSDRAHYELCVLIKDIGRRLPLQLQCSYQGQQDDFSQSVRGNYKTRFWGGQNLYMYLIVLSGSGLVCLIFFRYYRVVWMCMERITTFVYGFKEIRNLTADRTTTARWHIRDWSRLGLDVIRPHTKFTDECIAPPATVGRNLPPSANRRTLDAGHGTTADKTTTKPR